MDGLSRATTDTRTSGQRKVLAVTAATGLAAVGITGTLTVALGSGSATTATSTTTTPRTTTPTTTAPSTDSGTAAATTTARAPVASSGGS